MLARFSKMLSSFFISREIIKEDERDIYDYSFEIMFSTIINFLVVFVISLITHTILYTCFYIVSFMIVRGTAGGYHAKNHLTCLMILVLCYGSFLILLKILPSFWMTIVLSLFVSVSCVLVFIFSPVEDHNKPLNQQEKIKFKKKSRIVILLLSFFSIVLSLLLPDVRFVFSISSGMVTVAISLVAGKVKNDKIKLKKLQN